MTAVNRLTRLMGVKEDFAELVAGLPEGVRDMTSVPIAPSTSPAPLAPVRVWDLPTRLFHWGLAGLLLVSWFTGEEEGAAALVHRLSGEAIAGLIVFRVVWGLVGGEHARFSDFIKGPAAVGRHAAQLVRGRAERTLGHNSLGGLSVVVMLLTLAAVVTTGLFSGADDDPGGPLAGRFGLELSDLHEPAFRILQALVVLHLLGVAVTSFASRENLLGAMITGFKRREPGAHLAHARRAPVIALLFAVLVGAGVSGYLMSLPHASGGERGGYANDEPERGGFGHKEEDVE